MVKQYIAIALFLSYLVAIRIPNKKERPPRTSRKKYYSISLLESFAVPLVLFLIDPDAFRKIDFARVGRGFTFDPSLAGTVIISFAIPVIFAMFRPRKFTKSRKSEDALYGAYARRLPLTYSDLSLFILLVLAGVVSEELLFRQFLFSSFYTAFHLEGDILLVVSAVLFAAAHNYKKVQHIALVLFSGLVFGKAFQFSGTLLLPIILHFLMNATMIVMAVHRIKNPKFGEDSDTTHPPLTN